MHLDLKPKNIMFKNNSLIDIVLLDFGTSKIYKENESTKIVGMSPAYCPPEIKFEDSKNISPKSDIFSFGVFFVLLFYYIVDYYTNL